MNDLALFYLLKQKIMAKYREHYPYYSGSIHSFGNRDIAQLLDLVEQEVRERVSEKWVYTHLKPEANTKLPRKDMLDIFCRWLGYNGWDEFAHAYREQPEAEAVPLQKEKNKRSKIIYFGMGIAAILAIAAIGISAAIGREATVCLRDRYTQKEIPPDKVSLYLLHNGTRQKLARHGSCFTVKPEGDEAMLIAESPYYKADTLRIVTGRGHYELDLQPDDYAMMLRAYMNADVDDWNRRKQQLGEILSDDAVIEEIMFEDIGVEFLNKEEFIDKITTPTKAVKTMEIVEVKYKDGKIVSLKYMQKR